MLSQRLASRVLKAALSQGGEFAELFCERRQGTRIVLEDGRLEDVVSGLDRGVGVRLVRDLREVYGYSNDSSEPALLEVARFLARAAATQAKQGRRSYSFKKMRGGPALKILQPPADVSLESKVALVQRADQKARSHTDIRQVSVVLRDLFQEVLVANSEGLWAEDRRTHLVFFVEVVAERDDVVQTGYEPAGGTVGYELLKDERPELVADKAAERALRMLDAPKVRGGPMSVVLSSQAGGTMVHEAVGHGLEADLSQEGLSVYQGRLGQTIASPLITVVDDATLAGRRGSFRFDDEGTPSQRTVLIEQGVLKRYMESRLSAWKDGARPTGNGRRESYEHLPKVRMTNTLIAPGKDDPNAIVRSVEKGLLVTRMGSGQVNTVNGDFVFEVSEGFMIEKGRVGHPVRGATLTGNGPRVLEEIDQVGSDLGFDLGTCGKDGQGVPVGDAQPTLRIPELIVGGEG